MTSAWTTTCDVFEAITLLQPFDIDVPKIRYGSCGDGGYVFADTVRPGQPVLSFGVSDNCDLEYDFAERGHRVCMFDPSVAATPKNHNNFTFHQCSVAGQDSEYKSFLSLYSCLVLCGLKGRTDILLKIDTEGAGYSTFSAVPAEFLLHFEQIALKIHWLERLEQQDFRDTFCKVLQKINKSFVIFHAYANDCAPVTTIGGKKIPNAHTTGGYPMASVLELSFVRRDLVRISPSVTYYATNLDYPNHPFYPDHILSFYPFIPASAGAESQLREIARLNDLRLQLSGHQHTHI